MSGKYKHSVVPRPSFTLFETDTKQLDRYIYPLDRYPLDRYQIDR